MGTGGSCFSGSGAGVATDVCPWTPSRSASRQAASTAESPSLSTAVRTVTIWRSPSSALAQLAASRATASCRPFKPLSRDVEPYSREARSGGFASACHLAGDVHVAGARGPNASAVVQHILKPLAVRPRRRKGDLTALHLENRRG